MRLRTLGATVAAVLAMAGLAGCRTNVGTAAAINGHRITESDVNDFLNPSGIAPSAAAQAKAQGQTIPAPRSLVLQFLIQEQVFKQTLAHYRIKYTPGELAASHDAAAGLLLQTRLTGSGLDAAIDKQLPSSGVKANFRATFLRVEELEYKLIKTRKLTQLAELLALIKGAKISVSVSPRYGTWDPTQLTLSGKAVVPAYLSVQPTAGGAVTSQPAG